MDREELDLTRLRCTCGNEKDFLIEHSGRIIVQKKDILFLEERDRIDKIVCLRCKIELEPALFRRRAGAVMR